jgi:hypothetical protein
MALQDRDRTTFGGSSSSVSHPVGGGGRTSFFASFLVLSPSIRLSWLSLGN